MKEDQIITYMLQIDHLMSKLHEILPSDIKISDEYGNFSDYYILFREYLFKYIRYSRKSRMM